MQVLEERRIALEGMVTSYMATEAAKSYANG